MTVSSIGFLTLIYSYLLRSFLLLLLVSIQVLVTLTLVNVKVTNQTHASGLLGLLTLLNEFK